MIKALATLALGFTCLQVVLSQTTPPEGMDAEQAEILGLAQKLSRVSLAYRMAAGQQMLDEANSFASHLKLPIQQPITFQNAMNIHVTAPWYSKADNPDASLSKADRIRKGRFFAAGAIETSNFYFGYTKGRLWSVQRLKLKDESSIVELFPELIKTPSVVDSNGAYQLATQWLASVSVDVAKMERKNKAAFHQWHFNGKPDDIPKSDLMPESAKSTNTTMLPIFDIQWGEGEAFAAKVTVIGTTKELFRLEVRDETLSKRPLLAVPNAVELNERPEPPVMKLQRATPDGSHPKAGTPNPPATPPPPFQQRVSP
ncbi:MAG: hypothetical protein ACK45B_02710 [Limisphaerales bacterium]|jgi:hypothetical protein